jgi:hypothetical protein
MAIGPESKTSRRASPTGVDLEALRIGAAMEHIKAHGNLDGFPAGRGERLALVSTAARQGLLVWERSRGKYELTGRGRRHVRALRRAGRNALRERQGGAIRSSMNALVTAAGAVVVVGGVFLAFNPTSSTDLGPLGQPSAYFTSGAAVPARAQAAQGMQPAAGVEPKAVAAVASTDTDQSPSRRISTALAGERTDAAAATAGIGAGEPARSLAAAIGSEPEIRTDAVRKSAEEDHSRPETNKLAHKSKRSGRKHETVGPGYAYGPYERPGGYRSSYAAPWWFR